eukprot:2149716-Pyramimonas_sp.AAC.1
MVGAIRPGREVMIRSRRSRWWCSLCDAVSSVSGPRAKVQADERDVIGLAAQSKGSHSPMYCHRWCPYLYDLLRPDRGPVEED